MATSYTNRAFELTLDTIKPVVDKVRSKAYYQSIAGGVKLSLKNTEDITYYKAWLEAFDNASKDASEGAFIVPEDGNNTWLPYTGDEITIPGTSAIKGRWVIKLVLMDDVGNQYDVDLTDYEHVAEEEPLERIDDDFITDGSRIIIDGVAPTGTVTFVPGQDVPAGTTNATRSATNGFLFEMTDAEISSKIGYISIESGDATEAFTKVEKDYGAGDPDFPVDGEKLDFTFNASVEAGDHTIKVRVKDFAGNEYTESFEIHYDKDASGIVPTYYKGTTAGEVIHASSTAADASWIDDNKVTVVIDKQQTENDYVSYKLWTGDTEPTSWTAFTDEEKARTEVTLPYVTVPTGTTAQAISLKVQDHVGNIYENVVYVKTNTTAPVVDKFAFESTADPIVISSVTGYSTQLVNYKLATGADGCPINSYKIEVKNQNEDVLSTIAQGTSWTEVDQKQATLSAVSGLSEGANTVVITVTDESGKSATDTLTFQYDSTAPDFTITAPGDTWYKEELDPTVKIDVVADAKNIGTYSSYTWINNSPTTGSVPPAGATAYAVNPGATEVQIPSANIDYTGRVQGTGNYVHVLLVDAVGNKLEQVKQFKFDSVKPEAPTIQWVKPATQPAGTDKAIYQNVNASVRVTYSGNDVGGNTDTSGIAQIEFATTDAEVAKVNGMDLGTKMAVPTSGSDTSATLATGDGLKHLKARVIDTAGNISDWSAVIECELDTTDPVIESAKLTKKDSTEQKESPTIVRDFGFIATVNDDEIGDQKLYYQVSGDVAGTQEWIEVTRDQTTGKYEINNQNLQSTDGNGTKNIVVTIRDESGRTVATQNLSFELRVQTVNVMVKSDYITISKVHDLRMSSDGTTVTTGTAYWDKVIVDAHIGETETIPTSGDENLITEWEAHAYLTKALANAGSHTDDKIIAGTNGADTTGKFSVQMIVDGTAYENALKLGDPDATSWDGTHIVTVYLKDKAGNWSQAASFTL